MAASPKSSASLLAEMKDHYEGIIEDMSRDAAQQEASFLQIIDELREELSTAVDESDVLRLQLDERIAQAEELQLRSDELELQLAEYKRSPLPAMSNQEVERLQAQVRELQSHCDVQSAELTATLGRIRDTETRHQLRGEEMTSALTVANRLHEQQLSDNTRLATLNVSLTQQLNALRSQLEALETQLHDKNTELAGRLESSKVLATDVGLLTAKNREWERRLVEKDAQRHLDQLWFQELLHSVFFLVLEKIIVEEDAAFGELVELRITQQSGLESNHLRDMYWGGCLEEGCAAVENCLAIPQSMKHTLVKVTLPAITRLIVSCNRSSGENDTWTAAWEKNVCFPLQKLWKDQCTATQFVQSVEGLLTTLLSYR